MMDSRTPGHEPEIRIEVDPLSERSWDRIEHSIFAELRADTQVSAPPEFHQASRRRWRFALALSTAAAAAAAALFIAYRLTEPSTGPLASSRIVTREDASRFTVGEAELDVAPRSAVLVSGDDERGVAVVLERGSASFAVAPRRGRPAFVVHAGDVRIEVVGTRFSVERLGEEARVDVHHGTVKVIAGGQTWLLGSGENWERGLVGQSSPVAAVVEPLPAKQSGEPAGHAVDRVPERRSQPARHRENPRGAHRPASSDRSASRADEDEDSDSEETSVDIDSEQTEPPAPSLRERFATAQRLEPDDPAGAIAIYRDLARGSDEWAANALYQHAELELYRGNQRAAKHLAQQYLRRFPRYQNAADARDLLKRIP